MCTDRWVHVLGGVSPPHLQERGNRNMAEKEAATTWLASVRQGLRAIADGQTRGTKVTIGRRGEVVGEGEAKQPGALEYLRGKGQR